LDKPTIIALTTTLQPLLAQESYATVYLLSCPIVTTTVEKPTDQDWGGEIIPLTLKEFSSMHPSKERISIVISLPKIPEQPVTPPSSLAHNQQKNRNLL